MCEILSPILETLSANVEMLSPIGEIYCTVSIWEILSLIWATLSPNFGRHLRRIPPIIRGGLFQLGGGGGPFCIFDVTTSMKEMLLVCVCKDFFFWGGG